MVMIPAFFEVPTCLCASYGEAFASMEESRNVTIKDIAKKANVSAATAGRVLGKYGKTSEATRVKVEQAARELNYIPNLLAQGIRKQASGTIAVVVPDIHNNFFSGVVAAIERQARDHEYMLMICNTNESKELEEKYLGSLASKQVDGIVICSTFQNKEEISKHLYNSVFRKIPMVFFDRKIENLDRQTILTNNFDTSYAITKYLVGLGHKHIATIGSKSKNNALFTVKERENGYYKALKDTGLSSEAISIELDHYDEKDTFEAIERLTDRDDITAYIVFNNSLCPAFLEEMTKKGKTFPQDYSLVTWDDEQFDKILNISSIQQPLTEIGEIAVSRLLDQIGSGKQFNSNITITLSNQFVKRRSCRAIV